MRSRPQAPILSFSDQQTMGIRFRQKGYGGVDRRKAFRFQGVAAARHDMLAAPSLDRPPCRRGPLRQKRNSSEARISACDVRMADQSDPAEMAGVRVPASRHRNSPRWFTRRRRAASARPAAASSGWPSRRRRPTGSGRRSPQSIGGMKFCHFHGRGGGAPPLAGGPGFRPARRSTDAGRGSRPDGRERRSPPTERPRVPAGG